MMFRALIPPPLRPFVLPVALLAFAGFALLAGAPAIFTGALCVLGCWWCALVLSRTDEGKGDE